MTPAQAVFVTSLYPAQLGYFSGGEETRNDDEAVLAISVSSESESIVFLDPCRP
jgi:hypothetical protein